MQDRNIVSARGQLIRQQLAINKRTVDGCAGDDLQNIERAHDVSFHWRPGQNVTVQAAIKVASAECLHLSARKSAVIQQDCFPGVNIISLCVRAGGLPKSGVWDLRAMCSNN